MPIIPGRLKELRKRKKLSREELSHKSGITRRQIARLESEAGAASTPRDRTINKLAEALDVEPGALTGELPMPVAENSDEDAYPGIPRQVSAWVWPEASLAYTLIRKRHGFGLTTLVNAAPLMFVLLAGGSFVWRKERLEEVEETMKALASLESGYRRFPAGIARIEEGVERERESIEKGDLLGRDVEERWVHGLPEYGLAHDPRACNPFADYLRDLAGKIGDPEVVDVHEDEDTIYDDGPLKGFPRSSIYNSDLDELACGRRKLAAALRLGLRIGHMPERLLASDAADERQEWLDQQIEEQFPPPHKALLDRLESADDEERAAS